MHEQEIFLEAIEIPDPEARRVYLEHTCAGDTVLQAQVEALLQAHADAGSFLEEPAVADNSSYPATAVLNREEMYKTQAFSPEEALMNDRLPPGMFAPSTTPNGIGRLAHYEILDILGQGAFGVVLKAFDEKLHRMVAIKVMSAELAATSPARKRFLREARASAAIRHEHVVAIYAVEEQPVPYLVMEYVPGKTLQQAILDKGPFDVAEVLRLGQQMAQGLAAAHAQGLIHRDIKPANILLEQGVKSRVKITDFGLARAADDASHTQSGVIAGTPMYMSPEQAHGQKIDQRSDLFSLGSVLYVMLSGRPPFRAESTLAVLKRVTEDTPRPIQEIIPEVPEWLSAIVTKLHAKLPGDRFQTVGELAQLLENCSKALEQGRLPTLPGDLPGETIQIAAPVQTSPSPPATASAPRSRWFYPVAALLLLLLIGIGLAEATGMTRLGMLLGFTPNEKPTTSVPVPPGQIATTQSVPTQPATPEPASWHGWPADARQPAIAPFDATQARQHQEAWAKYLQVDVEYENSIGMKFVLIPPGEFTMGSTPEEIAAALKDAGEDKHWQEYIKSEAPQHKVILTQPIYLGVNEVSQAEYEKVMGTNPSHFAPLGTGKAMVAGLETTNHPVETVSWNDAADFCAQLSKQEKLKPFYFRAGEAITSLDGTGYRLPSEAEWEFACRAGTATKYWIGDQDEDLARAGWFGGNAGGRTHAAGELKANPFGLYDMHGNVWEWVQDGWDASTYGQFQEKPAINPNISFSAGSRRVVRAGNWGGPASSCRSSHRRASDPPDRNNLVGFRVALPVAAVRQVLNNSPAPSVATPSTPAVPVPLDLTPPAPLGTWKMGPEPPWFQFLDQTTAIKASEMLPGLIDRPATLAGIKRWNVDTVWSRGPVNVARWSPDGKWLATGAGDGNVRIYQAETMELDRLLPGIAPSPLGVLDLAWHPDSERLAVASESYYIDLLRIYSRQGVLLFEESGPNMAQCVGWSSDGKFLAVGGKDRLSLRNADGTVVKTFVDSPDSGGLRGGLAWSPDNQQLAFRHLDKVRLWNISTGEAAILDEDRPWYFSSLAWGSKDWIALTDGQNLRLYDPDRKLAQTVPYQGHAVAWHPDGQRVFLPSVDQFMIWDCTRQEMIRSKPFLWGLPSHPTALDYSPHGDRLVTGRGLIRVQSADLEQVLFESSMTYGEPVDLRWSPDGQSLASAHGFLESGIRLWSAQGQAQAGLPLPTPPNMSVFMRGIAWSPEGRIVVAASSSGIWIGSRAPPLRQVLPLNSISVSWSRDGRHVALGGAGKVVILDRAGEFVEEVQTGEGVAAVAWSPAADLLAVHCGRRLQICDPQAGWALTPLAETNFQIEGRNPVWSPDGRLLSIYDDRWYARQGEQTAESEGRLHSHSWRADGQRYLSWNSGVQGNPVVLRSSSGTILRQRWDDTFSHLMTWHPRGHLFATTGYSSTITAWDASDSQPYWHAVLLPEQKSVTFSAAGEMLDGDPETVEKYLIYYVERDDGRIEMLKPSEFLKLVAESPPTP